MVIYLQTKKERRGEVAESAWPVESSDVRSTGQSASESQVLPRPSSARTMGEGG